LVKSYETDVASNEKVELIHISRDDDEGAALDWARKEGFPWPTLSKQDASKEKILMQHYGGAVPTYVLIDKDGNKLATGKSEIWAKLKGL
jgi:hypothetical protein